MEALGAVLALVVDLGRDHQPMPAAQVAQALRLEVGLAVDGDDRELGQGVDGQLRRVGWVDGRSDRAVVLGWLVGITGRLGRRGVAGVDRRALGLGIRGAVLGVGVGLGWRRLGRVARLRLGLTAACGADRTCDP